MKRRRFLDVFSLSFLDCICCGFGSVILLFVIVNTRTDQPCPTDTSKAAGGIKPAGIMTSAQLKHEKELLKLRVSQTHREIRQIRNEISILETRLAEAIEHRDIIAQRIISIKNKLESQKSGSSDSRTEIEQLQEDLRMLETEINTLQAAIKSTKEKQEADNLRRRAGDGYRHYLTGLTLSGQRTLILLDCSASMLSDHIVDILRRRNMNEASRRAAPKWRQAVAAVDWLLTQLPADGQFQLFGFNETPFPVLKPSGGQWLQASDTKSMDELSVALHELAPEKGTSLYKALKVISKIQPSPDNVVLMTDGLPTMGSGPSLFGNVSARRRLSLFRDAIQLIPEDLQINVILYQIEGDPEAASAFWGLAKANRGSFFCPSRDWP